MPRVGGKIYPYTSAGKKAAAAAEKRAVKKYAKQRKPKSRRGMK